MKRLEVLGVMLCFIFMSMSCSTSSYTQEEYDNLLAENDKLQTEYDELSYIYDQLYDSNQAIKDKIKELKAMTSDNQIFNVEVYNILASEHYSKDDVQDQRLWGTYSVDTNGSELYMLYSSGLYINLYMTTDSEGQYYLTYGTYSFDQSNNQLSIKNYSSDNTLLYIVEFNDNGMKLNSINSNYQHEEAWNIIK